MIKGTNPQTGEYVELDEVMAHIRTLNGTFLPCGAERAEAPVNNSGASSGTLELPLESSPKKK
jgi:hypothetical protein